MFSNIHFFPYVTSEWEKLDLQIRKANSLLSFKNALLKLGRLVPNSYFNIHNPVGLKILIRLRAGLSNLNENKISNTIYQIVLIPYVPVVWKLNQLLSFFCTVFVFQAFVKSYLMH